MLNFNYKLIYSPVFITILLITFILVILLIYYNFFKYKIINYEIQSVKPKKQNIVTYYNHSLIDKFPVINNKFPEFKNALIHKVELKCGNSLFIPAGWWHWVFSEDNCIAFSHIVHNFDENAVKKKQTQNYKDIKIKYYNSKNIDYIKHSNESIPLIYNDPSINIITESFLEENLDKINLMISKTNTIVNVNKENNTTNNIINGNYKYFNILNNSSDYFSYIGMSQLNKDKFKQFINNEWSKFANTKNNKNDIYLWHSKKIIDTGLHYDITDNLLTIHSGKKTILLFPPSETKYLYNELLNNVDNYGYFTIK